MCWYCFLGFDINLSHLRNYLAYRNGRPLFKRSSNETNEEIFTFVVWQLGAIPNTSCKRGGGASIKDFDIVWDVRKYYLEKLVLSGLQWHLGIVNSSDANTFKATEKTNILHQVLQPVEQYPYEICNYKDKNSCCQWQMLWTLTLCHNYIG